MTPFEKIVEVLKAQTSEIEAEGRALRQFLKTSGSPEWVDLQKAGEAGTVECDHLVQIAAAVAGIAGMRFLMHWLQQRPLNQESARCILGTLQDGAQQCAKFREPSRSEGIKALGQMVMDPTVTSEIRCDAITTACWLAPDKVGHGLLEWIGCQDLAVKKAALKALETWAEILLRDPSFRRLFEEVRVDQVPSSTDGLEWGLSTDNSGELEPLMQATKHEDGDIRRLASLALAELPGFGHAASPYALADLKSADSHTRQRAVEELESSGYPEAVSNIIPALRDPCYTVRNAAAAALGRLGDRRAVLPLRDALSDTQFSVRRLAARSLGILGDPRAVEPLVSLLSDPHRNVRQDAVDALALLADQRAIPALEQAAVHDKNQGVRQRAARALISMKAS